MKSADASGCRSITWYGKKSVSASECHISTLLQRRFAITSSNDVSASEKKSDASVARTYPRPVSVGQRAIREHTRWAQGSNGRRGGSGTLYGVLLVRDPV